jgi:signal transduction histidine kinase
MNTAPVDSETRWRRQQGSLLQPQFLLPIGIGVGAFTIDVLTPHGFVDGFLYVLAVLVCIWVPSVNAALYTAIGLMPLLLIGFIASPAGAPSPVAVANLLVGIATIWIAAAVVWHNARSSRERESLLRQIRNLQRMTAVAAENERKELSRWLHEGIGQELAAVGWGLDYIARRADQESEVRVAARELRALIDGAQETTKAKAAGLRHPPLDGGGLRALVERHADRFSTRTDITVAISGAGFLDGVPESQADLCFRIVQEALTNVAKHSGARHVEIGFHLAQETLHASISDDGRGLSAADQTKPNSLGLLGLRERLLAIGGELLVANVAPRGARVEARLPLHPTEPRAT